MLERAGFKVVYANLFDRVTELNGENGLAEWIEMFVKIPFSLIDKNTKTEIIAQAVQKLRNDLYKEEKWYADYVRLRVRAIKE